MRGLVPAGFMLGPVDGHLAFLLRDLNLPVAAMPAGEVLANHHHMHMAADHAAHQYDAHG